MRFVGSNSQVYYNDLQFYTGGHLQISEQDASFKGSIVIFLKKKALSWF